MTDFFKGWKKITYVGLAFIIFALLIVSFNSSAIRIVNVKHDDVALVRPNQNIKILFVGDMMFDRYIRQISISHGQQFVFGKISDLLKNNDLVVGNLEGPITDNPSVSVNTEIGSRNNYIFTFDPGFAKVLQQENIKLVNIGNNHITNFNNSGIESTRKYLSQSGVDYFGDPEGSGKRIFLKNFNGFKIAFINYNQFVSDGKNKTLEDIALARKENADLIFLYTHWGTEFTTEPNEKIKTLAHEFIDAGTDLIIGTHPHVVETSESYKGKMIYYSLGNFIFDQYFDPKTQQGMAIQVNIQTDNKKMSFDELKIQLKTNGQTILLK